MTEQEVNLLIDAKIAKVKMSQLPETDKTGGLYSIGYIGNQSVKYKANLLQGDPLTVRKTYQTEAEALADKNPIDTTTSLPLTVGQFVSIVDDGEKNGIYRISSISGDGTMVLELQGKLGDLSEYAKKTEVDDDLAQLAGDVNQKYEYSNEIYSTSDLTNGYFAVTLGSKLATSSFPATNKKYMFLDVQEGESYILYGRSIEPTPRTYAIIDNTRTIIECAPAYTTLGNTAIEITIPSGGVQMLVQVMNWNNFRLISVKVGRYLNKKVDSVGDDLALKADQVDLVQLAGDVSVLDNKTLNIKPINLFEWGRLNALGFNANTNVNYAINELGHIITAGTFLIDIPVTHLRGKRIFFGTKKKSSYLDYCQFYSSGTQLSSPAPVNTLLGIDENGFDIISITHPSNGDIVPLEATHLRIQYKTNVEIVEIYAGETPYTGDTLYPQDLKSPEPYKYLGGIEIATQESSIVYPNTKGVATFNIDGTISIAAGGNASIDVALNLNSILQKIKGKTVYMNVKAENTDLRGVYFQLHCYNVISGVFTSIKIIHFSISSGEITTLPELIPDSTNYIRMFIRAATAGDINIDSISFSESKHYSTDIKVYDDVATAIDEAKAYTDTKISEIANISERGTLYEAMQENLQNVLVGTKQFRKVAEDNVTNITDEVNNPNIYYSPKKRIPSKVQNLMVVDTKGTVQDAYNRGRLLEWISPDGWMYFRNAYNTYQKISVETFLSNLIPHDGSGITSDNIDWLELPAEQTIAEKAAKLAEELPNWKMHDETKSSDFQTVYSEPSVGWITRQMANGSLVNQNRLIRKDGTVVQPILKNPVLCNPTHLIIKENGSVLYEIPLKNAVLSTGIKWGEMKANQGDITYVDNIYAAINFNHNKTITLTGINLLSGHTYDFTLRGRRYGTNCVNGSVNIINVSVIGSIPLTDPIMGGTNSATLVDNTATITLNKNISDVTLRANAPAEKPFNYGNGATATPNWGYMASDDKMLITEYEPTAKRAGMAYLSQDNGESYDVLFDVSLNENFCNIGGGHIHGGCFDPYWNKVVLVLGDSDFAKGIYHADYVDGLKQDNVSWTREAFQKPFYGASNGEQYCSAYPHEDFILFGTDCVPTGIFRMPRINKKEFTKREPSKLISGGTLSHIPSMFFRENENSPIFIATMRGTPEHPDRLYNTSIYHATWDGIYVQEIFKDKIRCGGFGNNVFMGIFYYKGKVFMTQFGDNRFENGHTLFIGDYRV